MLDYIRRPLCLVALLFAGAVYLSLQFFPVSAKDYSSYEKASVTLTGYVVSKEIKISQGLTPYSLLITLDRVRDVEDGPIPEERVLVRIPVESETPVEDDLAPIGSWIRVSGSLRCFNKATNHGEFDSALYQRTMHYSYELRSARILAVSQTEDPLGNHLYHIKRYLAQILNACTASEEDAAILRAMLLGEKGMLTQETKDLYQGTGIIHILAISGLHIAIIGMGLYRLLCGIKLSKPMRRRLEAWFDRYIFDIHGKKRFWKFWRFYNRYERRERTKRLVAAVFSILVMYLYGRMTGMGASSFRAIVMFMIHLVGLSIHRTYDLLNSLAIAAILLLIEQPLYLYHSGFIFSFAAVISIGVVSPALPDREIPSLTFGEGPIGILGNLLIRLSEKSLQGFAVHAGTYPAYLWINSSFPIYSVLLNLFILPLMGILMVTGIIALFLGSFVNLMQRLLLMMIPGTGFETFGSFICGLVGVTERLSGLIPHGILYFYRAICEMVMTLPGHGGIVGHPPILLILLYLASLYIVVAWTDGMPRVIKILPIIAAMLMLTFRFDYGCRIHVIDVGQGDGILIQCEGKNILIDGGSTTQSEVGKYQIEPVLKYYGVNRLDMIVMTHEDKDHMSGIVTLLDDAQKLDIRIGTVLVPSVAPERRGENYLQVETAAKTSGAFVQEIHAGEEIVVGSRKRDGRRYFHKDKPRLRFTCLHPGTGADYPDANSTSVVLYMQYGAFDALFTGDLEEQGEVDCLRYIGTRPDLFPLACDDDPSTYDHITLLKVAHHGSSGATSEDFLQAIIPQYAVISCGVNNTYGHPHQELLNRLKAVDATIHDTRYTGEITYWTDGKRMKVEEYGGRINQ